MMPNQVFIIKSQHEDWSAKNSFVNNYTLVTFPKQTCPGRPQVCDLTQEQ